MYFHNIPVRRVDLQMVNLGIKDIQAKIVMCPLIFGGQFVTRRAWFFFQSTYLWFDSTLYVQNAAAIVSVQHFCKSGVWYLNL